MTKPNQPALAPPGGAFCFLLRFMIFIDQCPAVAKPDRWAAMRRFATTMLLVLPLSGCFFGDPIATRTVSLKLPAGATGTDTQPALTIIDGVLVSHGFTNNPSVLAPEDKTQGLIAFYGVCTVSSNDNRLGVNFVEKYQRHSSAVVKRMCRELKDKLSTRYGAENVDTQDAVHTITVR